MLLLCSSDWFFFFFYLCAIYLIRRVVFKHERVGNGIISNNFLNFSHCFTWLLSLCSVGYLVKIVCVQKSHLVKFGMELGSGCICTQRLGCSGVLFILESVLIHTTCCVIIHIIDIIFRISYDKTTLVNYYGNYLVLRQQLCAFLALLNMRRSCGTHLSVHVFWMFLVLKFHMCTDKFQNLWSLNFKLYNAHIVMISINVGLHVTDTHVGMI